MKSEELFNLFETGCNDYREGSAGIAAEALNAFDSACTRIEKLDSEKHSDELCAHYCWDNGSQSVFLCPKASAKGVFFGSLAEAAAQKEGLTEKLNRFDTDDAYARMTDANARETVVLYIPRKMCQKREYLLDIILSDPMKAAALKIFICADEDACGVVTINLRSREGSADTFCAAGVYCYVGKNANLVLNEVQDLNAEACSVMRKQTIVDEGGNFHWNVCELGTKRSASSLNVTLAGQNSSAIVYGLYFPNKEQRMTMLTRQDHLVPNTFSNLFYKGALTDQAQARWEGMVYVSPQAGKADGYQKNENLMLSPDAKVFAKPGLEIIMDDVKCSHGTTITDIDDNQIFYLTSRGIPQKEAERLVIQGFFDQVLNLVTYSPIRAKLQEKIAGKLV